MSIGFLLRGILKMDTAVVESIPVNISSGQKCPSTGSLINVSWTGGRKSAKIITSEMVRVWMSMVTKLSRRTLENRMFEEQGFSDDSAELLFEETFRLFSGQREGLRTALQIAGEISNSSRKSHQIDTICTVFMAAQQNTRDKTLSWVLRRIEHAFGVKLVAFKGARDGIVFGLDTVNQIRDDFAKNCSTNGQPHETR